MLGYTAVAQVGYIILGLASGTAVGLAGGLFHMLNHAIYKSGLFLCAGTVERAAGSSDLDRLGGLARLMPITFGACLVTALAGAGIPPLNGFVSKWMVYRALLTEGMPLLFVGAVIGTLGTILSVYKLIHNIFLWQLRIEHEGVREAPLSMLIPMLGLSAIIFLSGFIPGPALAWASEIGRASGRERV